MAQVRHVPVDEFTTPSPVSVSRHTAIEEIKTLMKENGIRHVPVLEGGNPVGIVSDRDLKLALSLGAAENLTAEAIMSSNPYTVSPETSIDEVAFQMSKNKFGSAIIQDESGQVTGIFTSTDALNALVELVRGELQ